MPVHDAMYTHSVANSLQKQIHSVGEAELYNELEEIKRLAHQASSDSAKAALRMFKALDMAKKSDSEYTRELAEKILKSQYNVEIA